MRAIWILIALGFLLLVAFIAVSVFQIRESASRAADDIQAIREVFDRPLDEEKPQVRVFNE
jgi:hypothetical protein